MRGRGRKSWLAVGLGAVLILVVLASGGCGVEKGSGLKVVTGSSLLSYLVKQVGGERVAVTNLVPPAQHPGNFNAKPGDMETLATADLFILHGWPGEQYGDKLVAAANNPKLKVIKANVDGNWMIPAVQMTAADRVASILGQADSAQAAYRKAAEEYKARVQTEQAAITGRLAGAGVARITVICSVRQADFLRWAGFQITATYDSPESLTPQVVKGLVDKGRAAGVTLVVDNLQDSAGAGKGLAEELGARNISLSNFPGGLENTESWEKALEANIDLVLKTGRH